MSSVETMTAQGASSVAPRVHFGCSRCGACCNSTPQLSLPELFRHQTTFIGCLTVGRIVQSVRGLDPIAAGELSAFVARHGYEIPGSNVTVSLASRAYDDPKADRCPALADDKLCSLQDKGKPLACRSVPLEAALPDAVQLAVLEERAREAHFMGADCIQLRAEPLPVAVEAGQTRSTASLHLPVIVEGTNVVDLEARRALELRRAALLLDRLHWGERVFQLLRRDLFDQPDRLLGLPAQGYLCLPLAPALSVVSSFSNALTRRVIEYLNAQIELIALTLGAPVKEPTQAQRELSSMLRVSLALRAKLHAARPLPQPEPQAPTVEAWLLGQALEAAHG